MAKKPLMFGEQLDEQEKAALSDPRLRAGDHDPFYIPGYSEQLKARDLAKGDPRILPDHIKRKYYQRFGTGPVELRHEFTWVRVASPSGTQSYNADVDATEYYRRGYRPVEVADAAEFTAKYGYDFPPAATVVEGKIRQLDLALFVIDGEQARRNREEQDRYNEFFHGTNQPKEGEQTRLPFDIVDFEEDEPASKALDDLPDAFTAGPNIDHNR
jgi:hypothetical protein